jgi:hypothetical protein
MQYLAGMGAFGMHRCDPLLLVVGGRILAAGLGVRCSAAFGSNMTAAMQEVCC